MTAAPSPDVIIIGAGVIGASCAFHLARAGARVTVLEAAPTPGAGSTWRATGGFRAQYGTEINVRLSLLARERLRAFADETGVCSGFDPVGYLWLAADADQLRGLAEANELQRRCGLIEARLVERGEIAQLAPHAALEGIAGGAWCPADGVLRPAEIQRGYLEAAARLGADVRWGEPVVGLRRAGGGDRIEAAVTPRGEHAAGIVVDAAGPWAALVAAQAGVALPVVPLRRQVALTVPTDALPPRAPLTIWLGDGFHVRMREGRALLLRPSPGDPADAWSTAVEPAWLDDIAARAAVRVPPLAGVPLDRAGAWAGLYEMSPDHHALLGPAPGCENLLLVNGSSGHGVMHAPALGLLAAEIALGGAACSLDVRALRPSRFAEGEPVRGPALL